MWYFLLNNRAYCLNQIGEHQEAGTYAQAAIGIDPGRHNTFKNLGVSLQGQGRFVEAAENFIRAAKMAPTDTRALAHLEELISGHREILKEIPDLLAQLHECHEAVQGVEEECRLQ